MSSNYIDTEQASLHLRSKGIIKEERKVLITRFTNTEQEADLSLPPNCNGLGRIHHFKKDMGDNFPKNPLPIEPALKFLNLPQKEAIQVQVFQNAICSWRCWYCFVDYKLLAGNKKFSEFKTAEELIDLYEKEKIKPPIIDLSGGQPDLVPEWTIWFADELKKRGLNRSVYLWSDDNLSNDFLWRYLTREEIKRLASYENYGRVGCFKGFDEASFSFNTGASPDLFMKQFGIMKKIVAAGFDVYGYATFTAVKDDGILSKMSQFCDLLQDIHPNFPLRTVPLRIFPFTPTLHRMDKEIHERALKIQEQAMEAWTEELRKRFSPGQLAKRIFEHKIYR